MAACQNQLELDATALTASGIGAAGPDATAITALAEPARHALETTLARCAKGEIGFLVLPDDRAAARACMDYARDLDPNIDTVVVLGIGGSITYAEGPDDKTSLFLSVKQRATKLTIPGGALAGPLYGVDPVDQPVVEEAKRLGFAALGRPGYEQQRDQLARVPGPEPKYVL